MLKAFHNDKRIKEKYLARVHAHKLADELEKGYYWEEGKGCAVGCTIHGSDHELYETELGIPSVLARLEDKIFEGSSDEWSKEWPERFLTSIPVGADLSKVATKFIQWLLVDEQHGVIKYAKTEQAIKAIRNVADAYDRDNVTVKEWESLRDAAYAAAGAYAAADAAAYAAASAVYSADAVVDAKKKAFEIQGEKLLELLASAPIY